MFYFYGLLRSLSLQNISWIFFLKPVYPMVIAKKFQIHGFKITGKYICESKNECVYFYTCPQAKLFPRFLSSPLQAEGNYPFPQNNVFWKSIFSSKKHYGTEKITKIKLVRVLVTSFNKFHRFCNLYLVPDLLCHTLNLSIVKCDGFFT